MREEAAEAWRNVDPKKAIQHGAKRDLALLHEVEALLGPDAWDTLAPATHISWGAQAICHWTRYSPAHWPPTQKAVKIADLIVRLPCAEDETLIEFVAHPDPNWNGVSCDACRVRLPTLLRELSVILDDMHEGIIEGHRALLDTRQAHDLYLQEIESKLTAEQRERNAVQAKAIAAKNARRAVRRSRQTIPKVSS